MKKKFSKILSCALSAVVVVTSFTSLVGCKDGTIFGGGGDQDNPAVDTTKSQLYVGVFDGGLGREWAEDARTAFEAQYADVSFESGKTGVQIMYDYSKTDYLETLIDNMPTNRQEVYIIDGLDYDKFVSRGHLLEISDVVTDGGENSLENRMNSSLSTFFKTGGKYYAVPWYNSFVHMIYDVDLFDSEHLWFAPDGSFVEVDNASTTPGARRAGKSGGEDGWDAGLPETYTEFFILLEEMLARGITPFTWSGAQIGAYLQYLETSFWADYQGAEEFAQNYTLNGEVTIRTIEDTNFNESAVGTFSVPAEMYSTASMTLSNAQEVAAKQAGKYYALKLAHDIMYQKKYVNQARVNSPAESHLLAQATYLQSTRSSKKIAMLVEGSWWYNEAKSIMDAMETYGSQYSAMNRRFGVMPIPKADDGTSAEGRTYASPGNPSAMFISKYINQSKIELAKEFLKFVNTEESMCNFTLKSGALRPYEYSLEANELAQLPYYTTNLIEASKDINFEYLVPRVDNLRVHNEYLSTANWRFGSRFNVGYGANESEFSFLFSAYFSYPDLSALTWFKGLNTYRLSRPYDFTV